MILYPIYVPPKPRGFALYISWQPELCISWQLCISGEGSIKPISLFFAPDPSGEGKFIGIIDFAARVARSAL